MRIGFLTYGFDRAPTGIGRYAIELLRALSALPDRPEIVLLTTERTDPHAIWPKFEHHMLPGCRLLPALMTMGNALLSAAAWRYKLDLIHDPNGIAPFLSPSAGVRRIVTIHDAFAYVCPDEHDRLDNLRCRWMLPMAARSADAVLTVSEHSRQDLVRHLRIPEKKIHAIPLATDARFQGVSDTLMQSHILTKYGVQPPYLLYLGGINARKNISRLFEAYSLIRKQYPNVTLVIGGKRQWKTGEIDTVLRRLQLENDVHFTGYVDDVDLPALYSGAEAFVFPSLYEGFGLPPLEAMACGTPVITSKTSSLPEVVGDAALTVDPYDVGALANAIGRVLADQSLRAELRRRGVERATCFTWDRVARQTMAVYEQVLDNPTNDLVMRGRHIRKERNV